MVSSPAELVELAAMSRTDLPRVVTIDALASPCPWQGSAFLTELARDDRRYLVARVVRGLPVGQHDAEVVGFAGLALLADEGHVMTLAVDPAVQGRGVGARLVAGLLEVAASAGLEAVTLEVRASNGPARRLYGRAGFEEAGVRPRYYPDGEDAVIMWRR